MEAPQSTSGGPTGSGVSSGSAETAASAGSTHPAPSPYGQSGPVQQTVTVRTPDLMRELGRQLAALLRPGDLVLLTGELGAGKTTLARGLGEGLGVRGDVTSPTFVIARVHPSLGSGPPLVHVDAYRLGWEHGGGLEEMEDLDLDVSLPESVVVVEWGEGRVEELAEDRLHVVIDRTTGGTDPYGTDPETVTAAEAAAEGQGQGQDQGQDPARGTPRGEDDDEDVRTVTLTGIGPRWADEPLYALG